MNLKAKFLTLSMKEQICITIFALYLFCILVLLSICCSLAYEILKEDFNQKNYIFMININNILKVVFIFKIFVYYNMKKY